MSTTTTLSEAPAAGQGTVFRKSAVKKSASETPAPKAASTTLANFKDQQSGVLPHKKLMVVFPAIALAQMLAYLDQTSVSTALPAIGEGLGLGSQVSWVATCFLIASTSIQLINGRLSDIFGRKPLLLSCMALLACGNLGAGFATNPAMVFAFRSLGGLGGGAITALVMIVASDITTLEQRGKYNGFIGAMVGVGNGLGPLIGGAVTQNASWRWCFWYTIPINVSIATLLFIVIPKSTVQGKASTKFKMIDWLGLFLSIAAVVLILVPISFGGSTYAWDSALVIAMVTVGALLVLAFLFVEWKVAKLPIMPIRLFQSDASANFLLVMSTFHGIVYWSNLFYVPLYLQDVRGYGPVTAGLVILPMVATQGVGSMLSGQIISRTGHYNPTIISGNFVWLIGASLQIIYNRTTPIYAICIIGLLQGIGIGCAFQPGLVGLLAHSRKADRAVVNSLRNFLRTMGGAIGLTISGTIVNNILKMRLKDVLTPFELNSVTGSSYTLKTLGLTSDQYEDVIGSYMSGIHTVFIIYAPLIGISFICSALVKDNGVAEKDRKVEPALQETGAVLGTSQSSLSDVHKDLESKEIKAGNAKHEARDERTLTLSTSEKSV